MAATKRCANALLAVLHKRNHPAILYNISSTWFSDAKRENSNALRCTRRHLRLIGKNPRVSHHEDNHQERKRLESSSRILLGPLNARTSATKPGIKPALRIARAVLERFLPSMAVDTLELIAPAK